VDQGVVLHVPAGRPARAPIVVRWRGGDRPGAADADVIELGEGATATSSRSCAVRAARRGEPQSLFTGTLEVRLGGRGAARREHPGPAEDTVAFQHRRPRSARAHAPLGARPARRAARPEPRRQPPVGDRSSVEQVEIVFGADDQLFDLTSYTRHVGRDTTGNLLSKARCSTRRAAT
jgi:hypothetical protein